MSPWFLTWMVGAWWLSGTRWGRPGISHLKREVVKRADCGVCGKTIKGREGREREVIKRGQIYGVCGRTKGREGREVSGKEDTSTWYRFLLQMNLPFHTGGLVLVLQTLRVAPTAKTYSQENIWMEIREQQLTARFPSPVSLGCYTKYCPLVVSSTETCCSQFWRLGSLKIRYRLDSWWGPRGGF